MSHVKGKSEGLRVTGLGRMEQCLRQASGGRVYTSEFPFLLTHTHTHPSSGKEPASRPQAGDQGGLAGSAARVLGMVPLLVQCRRVPLCPPRRCDTWSPLRHNPRGRVLPTLLVRAGSHAQGWDGQTLDAGQMTSKSVY